MRFVLVIVFIHVLDFLFSSVCSNVTLSIDKIG